jgi:hypothetical protein
LIGVCAAAVGEPSAPTHSGDGRRPIADLYRVQGELVARYHWIVEPVRVERLGQAELPINCLRTRRKGPALWIITGIHGEEPAGPNALAARVEMLGRLGESVPIVLLPMCNPVGYCRNWRYPNAPRYSEAHPGASVGDSDHLLPDGHGHARAAGPTSPECAALTSKVLALCRDYPPVMSIDFHEDDGLERGYIYSQGRLGPEDPVGLRVVAEFEAKGFPICRTGTTRFHEEIRNGMVASVQDGSIDELLSAPTIVVEGRPRPGPHARTVLVVETGSKGIPLPERVRGHGMIMDILPELFEIATAR